MATSVLVVSRNANVGVALVHQGFDVNEVRPDRHGDWTNQARIVDAVVLELSDAVAAEAAVLRLRAEGLGVPVLLVSNSTVGWETTSEHLGAGAAVLPLPISVPGLVASLENLINAGPVHVPPPPKNEEELLNKVAASVGLAIADDGTVVPGDSPPTVRLPEEPPEPEEPPAPPQPDEPEPAPEVEPVPEPARPAPNPMPEPPPAPRVGEPRTAETEAYIQRLLDWADDLTGVAECAEVVTVELAERLGADATALLLPDGTEWRVVGGTGLRPLEHRVHLAADHWLVLNVVMAGDGMVTDDSDGARDELIGAPLASWPRVLASPVPEVRGLFLAARSGDPFDPDALSLAFAVGTEAAPLLKDALVVRALARALAPYAEYDEP